MKREQLEHLIRAVGQSIGDDAVIVIGSQAILGSYPEGLPAPAIASLESDSLPLDDVDERGLDRCCRTTRAAAWTPFRSRSYRGVRWSRDGE